MSPGRSGQLAQFGILLGGEEGGFAPSGRIPAIVDDGSSKAVETLEFLVGMGGSDVTDDLLPDDRTVPNGLGDLDLDAVVGHILFSDGDAGENKGCARGGQEKSIQRNLHEGTTLSKSRSNGLKPLEMGVNFLGNGKTSEVKR